MVKVAGVLHVPRYVRLVRYNIVNHRPSHALGMGPGVTRLNSQPCLVAVDAVGVDVVRPGHLKPFNRQTMAWWNFS